jgi:gliding motility-associated-like protein
MASGLWHLFPKFETIVVQTTLMNCRYFSLLCLLGLLYINTTAQTVCTTLGQNPSTAFPVCGSSVFTQNTVPLCGGRGVPAPSPCAPNDFFDVNPFWYRFTCFIPGTLGLVITPMNLSDDYDWQIFDITGKNPMDVYTDPSMFVACNWSGLTGVTGASAAGTSLVNCGGTAYPLFSSRPSLQLDHEYLLLVSNFSASQSGYTLAFTGGNAGITDPVAPTFASVTPSCDGSQAVLRFNKKMKCNSLTANDFVVSPWGSVSSVSGFGCSSGFDFDSVLLTFSVPLPPNSYTINQVTGTDGNTLLDNCGTWIPSGTNLPFTVTPVTSVPMGTVGSVSCTRNSIVVNFADPILCSSIAANGSDFTISGPSGVIVNGAAATCTGPGETNSITVQFTGPILTNGNYQVSIATGIDGNTLLSRCNAQVNVGSITGFVIQPQLPVPMGTVTQPNCSPNTIVLNFVDTIVCSSLAADGSDFTITGPSPVTITGATATCNSTSGTNIITLQLSTPIAVSGNYLVSAATGSDGNTLIGPCARTVTAGDNISFTIPVAVPSTMTTIAAVGCSPSVIRVNLSGPVQCSSIAANGSDFIITGTSPVTITAATGACVNGVTNTVDVQLSAPIVTGGNYQLQLVTGSDGNTLLSDCNRLTPTGTSLLFTTSDTVSARFTYQVQSTCTTSDINFNHPGGNGINSWTWTINGNAASTQQTFIKTFPGTSQQTVQLTVTNGVCSDTRSETITLNNRVIVDFDLPDMICPEDSVVFTNLSTGPIVNWQWDFGNGQNSQVQFPTAQRYPLTGRQAFYNVTLTASNNTGCQDTKTKTIKVLGTCRIAVPSAFTPNNDGLNDFLYPLNAFKALNLEFRVYNRWGQLIFETRDWTKRWDGKLNGVEQASGMYVWTLRYKDKDSGEQFSLKGTSMLIR